MVRLILLALLAVAVVCVVVGVVTAKAVWLVVSLIASVLAALVLVRSYVQLRKRRTSASAVTAPASTDQRAEVREPALAAAGGGSVGLGVPDAQLPSLPGGGGLADPQVWVVDGHPEFHRRDCSTLAGRDPEPIPHSQAVEDGFVECTSCRPESDHSEAPTRSFRLPADVGPQLDEVWVVDGFPEFHRPGCVELVGRAGEAIPTTQAVEDGFRACIVCRPDDNTQNAPEPVNGAAPEAAGLSPVAAPEAHAPAEPTAPAEPIAPATAAGSEVWVVDGFPDYHRAGCGKVGGAAAETIPHDQAVEDGFTACAACRPDDDEPPVGIEDVPADDSQVWVVDGHPDYHARGCARLQDLGAPEAIPFGQAVEDGFAPCSTCHPVPTDDAAHDTDPVGKATEGNGTDVPDAKPDTSVAPREVMVVDGFPEYHRAGCSELVGRDDEPILHTQAVEDGFTPCPVCRPDDADAPAAVSPDTPSRSAVREVLVVDGFPDYHLPGCSTLAGLDDEPVPHDQAVEDGFAPCAVCRPEGDEQPGPAVDDSSILDSFATPDGDDGDDGDDGAKDGSAPVAEQVVATPSAAQVADADDADVADPVASDPVPEPVPEPMPVPVPEPDPVTPPEPAPIPEPVPEPEPLPPSEPATPEPAQPEPTTPLGDAGAARAQVWVLDGRPRFHAQDCLIIKGQDAQPLDHDEAIGDGFLPCSLCQR